MGDINRVNISLLKTYKSDFDHEKSNFKNSAYRTFSSSYLKNCGDATVKKMASQIDALYKKIDTGYTNIDRWWSDYNQSAEELEIALANPGGRNRIKESSLRNYVHTNLKELKEIKLDLATILTPKLGSYNKVAFSNNQAVSKIGQFQDLYGDYNVKDVNVQSVSKNQNVKGRMENVDTSAEGTIAAWKEKIFIPLKKSLQEVGAYVGTGEGKVKKNILEIGKQIALRNATPEQAAAIEVKAAWNQMRNILEQSQEEEGHWYDWAVDGYNYLADGASEVWNVTTGAVEYVWDDIVEEWEILKEGFGIMGDQLVEGFERLNATITTFGLSCIEGAGHFVEKLAGGVIILGAAFTSLNFTIPADILTGCFTGDWDFKATGWTWEGTRAVVENINVVTPAFDCFYDNTTFGQYLKEKTYGFDTVRSIGCGVGEMAATVALSVATCGLASGLNSTTVLTGIAAIKGLGDGTRTAWQEGAGTYEGLIYGSFNAAWEGGQYYVGAKIGQYDAFKNPIGGNLIKSQKASNALTRITLDSIDSGAEGFVQPALKLIYQKGYYDDNGNYVEFTDQNLFERYGELFDDNGGFNSVVSNAVIGGIGSTGGELFDLRKYFKQTNAEVDGKIDISTSKKSMDKKIESNVDANMKKIDPSSKISPEIEAKLKRYNEIKNMIDSNKDLQEFIENANNGYAQVLNPEFDRLDWEYIKLGDELHSLGYDVPPAKAQVDAVLKQYSQMKDQSVKEIDIINTEKKTKVEPTVKKVQRELPTAESIQRDIKSANTNDRALGVIRVNGMDDITPDILSKLKNPNDVLFSFASDGKLYSYDDVMKNMKTSDINVDKSLVQTKINDLAQKQYNFAKSVEPKVTSDLKLFEDSTAKLIGLEHKLKTPESLSRKIHSDAIADNISYEAAANKISDGLRYTLEIDKSNYVDKMADTLNGLRKQGYEINKFKNSWGDKLYQGVNVQLTTPTGAKMELQFHTADSFYTKETLNHKHYELFRSESATEAQKKLARDIMIQNQAKVAVPEGILELTLEDIKKRGLIKNSNLEKNIDPNIKPKMNQSEFNGLSLKKEILETINPNWSPLEKARKAYIELNKRLSYDQNYMFGDQNVRNSILQKNVNFANLNDSNIICKGWSELYQETLIDAGFDKNNIRIMGNKHKWIEVDLPNNQILIADATEVIGKSMDLANCKYGNKTTGFVVASNGLTGSRLSKWQVSLESMGNDSYNKLTDFKSVDKTVGYIDKNYFGETVSKAKRIFGNSSSYKKLFGKEGIFKYLTNTDLPSNMNGLDAYYYFKRMQDINNQAGFDNISAAYNQVTINGKAEMIAELVNLDDYSMMIYSQTTGKKVFNDRSEYLQYIHSLKNK